MGMSHDAITPVCTLRMRRAPGASMAVPIWVKPEEALAEALDELDVDGLGAVPDSGPPTVRMPRHVLRKAIQDAFAASPDDDAPPTVRTYRASEPPPASAVRGVAGDVLAHVDSAWDALLRSCK